jgi:hypothetical protein
MNTLIINKQIINFNYYYKRVFNPIYKKDGITNFNIPKIINKYYVIKSIYILQHDILEDYLENLEEKLNTNKEYKKITNILSTNFFDNKTIIDIAAFSYCLSRRNHIVVKLELDFMLSDIDKLISVAFENFLNIKEIKQLKGIYSQILHNYYNNDKEKKYTGLFLYTDFKLNELIITNFLKIILYSILKTKLNFIVYRNTIIFFCSSNKEKIIYVSQIEEKLLKYYIYFKNKDCFNLYSEDVIFRNNVILENYSCILKDKTFEFLKWQMEQKIEQEIPLSTSSEILLLEYITNKDFNIFKNNLKKKESEYYKKIKQYYDILVKNGCYR